MPRVELTDEQVTAIGHVVANNIGCNMQTGVNPDGLVRIYTQQTLNGRITRWEITTDGTVTKH